MLFSLQNIRDTCDRRLREDKMDDWRSAGAMRARRVGEADLIVSSLPATDRPPSLAAMAYHDSFPAVACIGVKKARLADSKKAMGMR